jgi:CRP/FNR family cyclic AMP-dependent transcriptional regulator
VARDTYLRYLAAVPLFAGCSTNQLKEIAQVADEVIVKEGNELIHQGAVGVELFIILEGTASVTRDGTKVATLGRGDFVGELAVLSKGRRRNATVTADTQLTVLVVMSNGLDHLLDNVPGLAKQLLHAVVNRLPTPETADVDP